MAGKWFTNRGQIIQVLIALIALLLGIYVALPQLPVQQGIAGLVSVWPIVIFPTITIIALWLFNRRLSRTLEHITPHSSNGALPIVMQSAQTPPATSQDRSMPFSSDENVERPAKETPDKSTRDPEFTYQFLTPTIKVGSYFDLGQEAELRRVSVVSIKTAKIGSEEVPVAEIDVTGPLLDFNVGSKATKIHRKKALIPANARSFKEADSSMFEFSYEVSAFSFVAISVDHINIPGQETNLVICLARFRKRA